MRYRSQASFRISALNMHGEPACRHSTRVRACLIRTRVNHLGIKFKILFRRLRAARKKSSRMPLTHQENLTLTGAGLFSWADRLTAVSGSLTPQGQSGQRFFCFSAPLALGRLLKGVKYFYRGNVHVLMCGLHRLERFANR